MAIHIVIESYSGKLLFWVWYVARTRYKEESHVSKVEVEVEVDVAPKCHRSLGGLRAKGALVNLGSFRLQRCPPASLLTPLPLQLPALSLFSEFTGLSLSLGQALHCTQLPPMAPILDETVDALKDLVHRLESRVQQLEAKLEGRDGAAASPSNSSVRMILMGPPGAGMFTFLLNSY